MNFAPNAPKKKGFPIITYTTLLVVPGSLYLISKAFILLLLERYIDIHVELNYIESSQISSLSY